MKTKEAAELAEVLWLNFCDFGPPQVLGSENEAVMVSEALALMLVKHGAEHRTIV